MVLKWMRTLRRPRQILAQMSGPKRPDPMFDWIVATLGPTGFIVTSALCTYVFLCGILQQGFWTAVALLYLAGGAAIAVAMFIRFYFDKVANSALITFWAGFGVLASVLWLSRPLDYGALVGALLGSLVAMAAYAIVWVVVRHGAADGDVTKSPWLAGMFVVAILVAWCVYSAWTLWREEEPLAVASSTALERSAHPSSPYSRVRVGLALSGGGYRAALMHAGVLAALEEHSVPVTHLSTVSGGSIIGAFYAIGGPPEAFRAAVGTGRMNLPGRLANLFNAVRLPFPIRVPWADVQLFPWFSFDRIDVQADQLDRVLLSRRKLADLAVDRGGQPRHPLLQICATDLNSGAAVGIASDGVLITRLPHYTALRGAESPAPGVPWAKHAVALREEPLARIVAASGAFPGAFNAVRMYVKEATGNQLALALSDGGVTDNLGVGLLLERHFDALHTATGAWQVDLVIVSDGSQPLGEARRSGAVAVIDELARAIDIVYAGSGWRPVIGDTRPLPRMAFLRPADVGAHPDVETFQKTSTLSDQIPRDSANSLYRLGTLLVERAWSDKLEPALRQLQSQREARPPTR